MLERRQVSLVFCASSSILTDCFIYIYRGYSPVGSPASAQPLSIDSSNFLLLFQPWGWNPKAPLPEVNWPCSITLFHPVPLQHSPTFANSPFIQLF